ncbi:hypothetical protein TorRG33x02_166420 [Trema orientale]|uniref:Retrotransposon gag domain-containing protein n=1 Tax=Trema orientale TaxID=63057 RepID=A0A2P5EPK0_TREOI|nr:hypothetical protein TorRG33x02_166420 [Trema orientale]
MATAGDGGRRSGADEHGTKALWASMEGLEQRFENFVQESQQRFDDFSREVRLVLAEIRDGRTVEREGRRNRDRDLPREQLPTNRDRNQHRDAYPFHHLADTEVERDRRFQNNHRTPGVDSDDDFEAWVANTQRYGQAQFTPRSGSHDYKLKMDIPVFDGTCGIEEFLDWVRTVESFFEYVDVPEDKQVKMVVYRFRGGATAWWDQLTTSRRREGRPAIRT